MRHLVLVWILLSQFPLPLVHAHGVAQSGGARLLAHLRQHHADPPHELWHHGLHWHMVSPWDATDGDRQEGKGSSPLGLWGAKGPAIPQIQANLLDLLDDALVPVIAWQRPLSCVSPILSCHQFDRYPSGFVQSYAGVPLCALLGVALR